MKSLQNLIFEFGVDNLVVVRYETIFHAPCPMPHAPCPMPHALSTTDRGNQYNLVAVLEDGVGGDEFQVEAEAGAIAPLF